MTDTQDYPPKSRSGDGDSKSPVLESLKTESQRVIDGAREQAAEFAEEQKSQGASYLNDLSASVQSMSNTLKAKGRTVTASYTDVAAEKLDQWGRDTEAQEFKNLVRSVQGFARERPVLFIGGILIAGFGLAQLLKTSAPDDPHASPPLDANSSG